MNKIANPISLVDLPVPPDGRTGWPWTEASEPLSSPPPGGGSWPRISIITPSYNQGRYIEETIRSVLLQGYPDLEYFIIDGGSGDETIDIIRKYEKWLSGWISEKDSGQSDAINKGFTRSTGDIVNWLCSDDLLAENALRSVAVRFAHDPAIGVVAGACALQYDDEPSKSSVRQADRKCWEAAPYAGVIWQPSCFFRRELVSRNHLVAPDLHYCMDRELWTYFWSKAAKWDWMDEVLSVFRFTAVNKSSVGGLKTIKELESIYESYFREGVPLTRMLRKCWLPLVRASIMGATVWIRLTARLASRGVTIILRMFYPSERVHSLQRDFYHYGLNLQGKP